jgi:hypothetical protein
VSTISDSSASAERIRSVRSIIAWQNGVDRSGGTVTEISVSGSASGSAFVV